MRVRLSADYRNRIYCYNLGTVDPRIKARDYGRAIALSP